MTVGNTPRITALLTQNSIEGFASTFLLITGMFPVIHHIIFLEKTAAVESTTDFFAGNDLDIKHTVFVKLTKYLLIFLKVR